MAQIRQSIGFFGFVLAGTVGVVSSWKARAVDPDLSRFATAKEAQAREYAESLTNRIPSIVWSFFDAVRVDDWETATNLAARLNRMSGRYENSPGGEYSPALRSAIWAPISEVIGTYDQFHDWNNK